MEPASPSEVPPTNSIMPRFFAEMPDNKPGRWVAVVIRTSHFREPREVWTREVTGYRWAYIVARLAALWEDISTPHWRDEIGIQWAVRDVESTQPQE